jgi:hypothetical protein
VKVSPWGVPGIALSFALLQTLAFAQQPSTQQPSTQQPSTQQPSTQQPSNPPGQATQSSTPSGQQQQSSEKKQDPEKNPPAGVSKDRLFYTLPNFLTLENTGQVPPLTTKEKFKVITKGSFDYVLIPWYGFLAGLSQAEDSEEGYGQGAAGYGKRFGAYFADGTIENYVTGAILPSLLRQDPRYFQSGKGSFMHRTGYSVSRIFLTRGDNGRQQFNYSEVFGSALSAGISTYSYHPHADRTLPNTLSVWGTQVGYDTMTLVVKEFWPDIRRKMSKNKNKDQ